MMWVIIILVVIIILIVILYNYLVGLNIRCQNAWSQIDNQLKIIFGKDAKQLKKYIDQLL